MSHTAPKGAGLGETPRGYHVIQVVLLPISLLTGPMGAPRFTTASKAFFRVGFWAWVRGEAEARRKRVGRRERRCILRVWSGLEKNGVDMSS